LYIIVPLERGVLAMNNVESFKEFATLYNYLYKFNKGNKTYEKKRV